MRALTSLRSHGGREREACRFNHMAASGDKRLKHRGGPVGYTDYASQNLDMAYKFRDFPYKPLHVLRQVPGPARPTLIRARTRACVQPEVIRRCSREIRCPAQAAELRVGGAAT